MRSIVSCLLLGFVIAYPSGCKREQRIFDPGSAWYTSGEWRFLKPRTCGWVSASTRREQVRNQCLRRRGRKTAL